jgi:hypothetical protein
MAGKGDLWDRYHFQCLTFDQSHLFHFSDLLRFWINCIATSGDETYRISLRPTSLPISAIEAIAKNNPLSTIPLRHLNRFHVEPAFERFASLQGLGQFRQALDDPGTGRVFFLSHERGLLSAE